MQRVLMLCGLVLIAGCTTRTVDTSGAPGTETETAATAAEIRGFERLLRVDWPQADSETKAKFYGRLRRVMGLPPGTKIALHTNKESHAPLPRVESPGYRPADDVLSALVMVPGGTHPVEVTIPFPTGETVTWEPANSPVSFDDGQRTPDLVHGVMRVLSAREGERAMGLFQTADPKRLALETASANGTERRLSFLVSGTSEVEEQLSVTLSGAVKLDTLYVCQTGDSFRAFLRKQATLTEQTVTKERTGAGFATRLEIEGAGTLVIPTVEQKLAGETPKLNGRKFGN